MSFIFEMDLALGAAKDISEDKPSLCFSSDNSNNTLDSDLSSDGGFKRRALNALIAYKIIKKKGRRKSIS
jgi:hypothetical protein